jgi:predicted metal-dependent hydrolase
LIDVIGYTTKINKRAKRISVRVYPDERVVVTMPKKLPEAFVQGFVERKSEWILQTQDWFKKHPQPVRTKHTKREIEQYKKEALQLVTERLLHFNQQYGFRYTKISIRNQKTRWGSCSRTGTLSFNYRIALLPSGLADYIIVHELCHLKEMNHSVKFWKLVSETTPDWKERRKALRKYQHTL